jgi:Protein of unknown function (DUF642)
MATPVTASAGHALFVTVARVPLRPRLAIAALLVLALALLAAASPASARPPKLPNLLTGGSFEHPAVKARTSHSFASIRGWRLAYGPNFELQNRLVGPAAAGQQYAELDSDASTGIFQRVHTNAETKYRLAFCASARPGTPPAENVLVVKWHRRVVARIALDGRHHSQTDWHSYAFKVTATGRRTRLEFDDRGISDSVGTLLDAVRLTLWRGHPTAVPHDGGGDEGNSGHGHRACAPPRHIRPDGDGPASADGLRRLAGAAADERRDHPALDARRV